ncbi:hypothetical protein C8J56DRAFT_1052966 [Mycena floridula]|nr:hypothetical protein C8J56DRAFT_1052966 [Mycena floridula]
MPNLVDCTIFLLNDESPKTTVRMPQLRRLHIRLWERRGITVATEFPKCLEVPVLEEMLMGGSDEGIEATARFIRRNACQIRALTITNIFKEWTIDDITPLSNPFPVLTKLSLQITKLIFPTLDDFSIQIDRSLPTLTSSNLTLVTTVVQNRPLLRKLHISARRVDARKTKRRFERDLQRFKALGLDLCLRFYIIDEGYGRPYDSF